MSQNTNNSKSQILEYLSKHPSADTEELLNLNLGFEETVKVLDELVVEGKIQSGDSV